VPLTTEQKILSAVAHLGTYVGFPILAPLLIVLLANDEFVRMQAKEALSYQLGVIIVITVLAITIIGIPLAILIAIVSLIFPVIAVLNLANGKDYSYPFFGRFVRK